MVAEEDHHAASSRFSPNGSSWCDGPGHHAAATRRGVEQAYAWLL